MQKHKETTPVDFSSEACAEAAQAVFSASSSETVSCPYCWTRQRAERKRCYHCGAHFVYKRDKVPHEGKKNTL